MNGFLTLSAFHHLSPHHDAGQPRARISPVRYYGGQIGDVPPLDPLLSRTLSSSCVDIPTRTATHTDGGGGMPGSGGTEATHRGRSAGCPAGGAEATHRGGGAATRRRRTGRGGVPGGGGAGRPAGGVPGAGLPGACSGSPRFAPPPPRSLPQSAPRPYPPPAPLIAAPHPPPPRHARSLAAPPPLSTHSAPPAPPRPQPSRAAPSYPHTPRRLSPATPAAIPPPPSCHALHAHGLAPSDPPRPTPLARPRAVRPIPAH